MFKHLPTSTAWFAAIFAALGTLFFCIGAHQLYRNWQFSGDAGRVIGTATRTYTTTSHGRHGSTTHYHIDFQYVAGDKRYSTTDTVTWSTYASIDPPAAIAVKYLRGSPEIVRIDLSAEDSFHAHEAWIATGAGVLFGGFGWFLFLGLERLIFYRRWLHKHGVKCVGRVKRIEASSTTVNNRPVRYLVYDYTDELGRKHEDSSEGLSSKQEVLWSDGDPIVVHYDRRDTSRSMVKIDKSDPC